MKSSSKRVENICCHKIGNSELKVFAENQITEDPTVRQAEFIFEIDASTKKQTDFTIIDLYKIMGVVYHAMNDYVEKNILSELKSLSCFRLLIEAEGDTEKEIRMKDGLYDYHLERFAQKITNLKQNVTCTHSKNELTHYLTFTPC